MSNDRNKPLWPWIVALLIGLPVLYVASFGPLYWNAMRLKREFPAPVRVAYEPLNRLMADGPSWTSSSLRWYVTVGMTEGDRRLFLALSGYRREIIPRAR